MGNGTKASESVCIYGIGGVGGYVGGKITSKLAQDGNKDYRIYFVARGDNLQEIRNNGLVLNTTEKRGLVCKPTMAVERLSEIPEPVDLILVCVKSYDLKQVSMDIANNISDETIIIPLLNGVDIYQRLRGIVSNGTIFPACVYLGAEIEGPGVVTQVGGNGLILFGKDPQRQEVDTDGVIDFFRDAGLNYRWVDNPYPDIWEKYIFIAAFALVSASSGKTLGEIMADAILKEQTWSIMSEISAIGKHEGVKFKDTIITESLAKANNFPYETKTSLQRDVERKAIRNEGDL